MSLTSKPGKADAVSNTLDGTINALAIQDGALTPAEIADPAGESDTIDSGTGNDDIYGDASDDILTGGADADTLWLFDDFGDDRIVGGEAGTDKIDFGGVPISLTMVHAGAESGTNTDGANTINLGKIKVVETCSAGDDKIGSSHGDETVYAGSGNDFHLHGPW